jgi:hypothetical protein
MEKLLDSGMLMTDSFGGPILRRGGDLFFNYVWDEQIFMVQVTRECLEDVFGSDGSREGEEAALRANMKSILAIAETKARHGDKSPIQVLTTDF